MLLGVAFLCPASAAWPTLRTVYTETSSTLEPVQVTMAADGSEHMFAFTIRDTDGPPAPMWEHDLYYQYWSGTAFLASPVLLSEYMGGISALAFYYGTMVARASTTTVNLLALRAGDVLGGGCADDEAQLEELRITQSTGSVATPRHRVDKPSNDACIRQQRSFLALFPDATAAELHAAWTIDISTTDEDSELHARPATDPDWPDTGILDVAATTTDTEDHSIIAVVTSTSLQLARGSRLVAYHQNTGGDHLVRVEVQDETESVVGTASLATSSGGFSGFDNFPYLAIGGDTAHLVWWVIGANDLFYASCDLGTNQCEVDGDWTIESTTFCESGHDCKQPQLLANSSDAVFVLYDDEDGTAPDPLIRLAYRCTPTGSWQYEGVDGGEDREEVNYEEYSSWPAVALHAGHVDVTYVQDDSGTSDQYVKWAQKSVGSLCP